MTNHKPKRATGARSCMATEAQIKAQAKYDAAGSLEA